MVHFHPISIISHFVSLERIFFTFSYLINVYLQKGVRQGLFFLRKFFVKFSRICEILKVCYVRRCSHHCCSFKSLDSQDPSIVEAKVCSLGRAMPNLLILSTFHFFNQSAFQQTKAATRVVVLKQRSDYANGKVGRQTFQSQRST